MKLRKALLLSGWPLIFFLIVLTTIFAVDRVSDVVENGILTSQVGADSFERRYNENPYLGLAHIVPGVVFMFLGPWQFMTRIRSRFLWLHRLSGRIYIVAGIVAGVTAILLAIRLPAFAGFGTASATFVFGTLFLFALVKALYHIKRREIAQHREWMIRAFAIGLGVSMIRVFVALFFALGAARMSDIFAQSFWLGLASSTLAGELWVRYTRPRRRSASSP